MHILKRNPLLSTFLIILLLFTSLIAGAQTVLAGDGSGGGKNPPLLRSACLTTINNNVSATGDSLGENMSLANNPPTIRIEFATNIADNTVWNDNKNYVTLYDGDHKAVSSDVSRIDPTVTFAERNYIFVKPSAALQPGSYTIVVDARLTSKNGISSGQEQTVSFSVAGNTDSNNNTNNDTGSGTNAGNNNNIGNNTDTNTNNNNNDTNDTNDTSNNNDTGSNTNNSNNSNNDSSIVLTDISGHWAGNNINKLVKSGVISGYPDGTFKPDKTISRAEFVTIIVRAFKLPPKAGKVFADTANHWAKDSIATAAAYGIVNGYNSTKFGPDDNITREQMAVILDKALKLNNAAGGKNFIDQAKISTWAKDAVVRVNQNGIFAGYPDKSFKPKASAARAEAATVILKALDKVGSK
ncbi:MAG: S-layer homology domain-containing protein [Syntrophomonas sp.]